jgi:hypothetical protein
MAVGKARRAVVAELGKALDRFSIDLHDAIACWVSSFAGAPVASRGNGEREGWG